LLRRFLERCLSPSELRVFLRLDTIEGLTTYRAIRLLSEELILPPSTVRRILVKFEEMGLMSRNPRIKLTRLFSYLRGDSCSIKDPIQTMRLR
jgi:DNA-binding MarR family transcriptional regulator